MREIWISPISSIWLIPTLTRFQVLHPKLKLNLLSSDRILNLEKGKIDLSIRFGADDGAHLIRNKFVALEFGFFCRADFLPERNTTKDLLDWIQEQGVYTFRPSREKHFKLGDIDYDVKSRHDFQVHDVLSLKSLILSGDRIGILPKFAVHKEVDSGVIKELLPNASIKGVNAVFLSGARRQDDARLNAIIEFLQSEAKGI